MQPLQIESTLRVGAYCRVSKADQMDGYSLDAQQDIISKFCDDQGWEIVGFYIEEGKSAYRNHEARREFRSLMTDAKNGLFDIVVVHTPDRFARRLETLLTALAQLESYRVQFRSVEQHFDDSDPNGRLLQTIIGGLSEYYSENLSVHIKKSLAYRAEREGLQNGRPSIGYMRCDSECLGTDDAHRGVHVDAQKKSIVLRIFEEYGNGSKSMTDIARELNLQHLRTNGEHEPATGESANESLFTYGAVYKILKNRFYVGQILHDGEYYDGVHQPLIDESLFERVQYRRRGTSKGGSTRPKVGKHAHLLASLLCCSKCNVGLYAEKDSKGLTRYKVPGTIKGLGCAFAEKSFKGERVERQIDQMFSQFELKPDWRDMAIGSYVPSIDAETAGRKKTELERQRRRAREAFIIDGVMSREEYQSYVQTIDRQILRLQDPKIEELEFAGAVMADFPRVWENATTKERNLLLLSCLDEIYVDIATRCIVGLNPKEAFLNVILAMAGRDDIKVVRSFPASIGDLSPPHRQGMGVKLQFAHLNENAIVVIRQDRNGGTKWQHRTHE